MNSPRLLRSTLQLSLALALLAVSNAAAEDAKPKQIVLVAGPKSHGPIGNGVHDYGWSVRLLKVMFEQSNVKDRVRVTTHFDGWPKDDKALAAADTVMIISDGRDGDKFAESPHLESAMRVAEIDRLMRRGCGLVTFHFSTFTPDKHADRVLEWTGGLFDWEEAGERKWYSAIKTLEAEVKPAAEGHAILRGIGPFKMREEFYYNLRFKPDDKAVTPILTVPALEGRAERGNVVAWCRERPGGGRGFGTTCGHFYDNWKHDAFRKLMLSAIAWTAGVEVPKEGVEAKFFSHDEIDKLLGPYPKTLPGK